MELICSEQQYNWAVVLFVFLIASLISNSADDVSTRVVRVVKREQKSSQDT